MASKGVCNLPYGGRHLCRVTHAAVCASDSQARLGRALGLMSKLQTETASIPYESNEHSLLPALHGRELLGSRA